MFTDRESSFPFDNMFGVAMEGDSRQLNCCSMCWNASSKSPRSDSGKRSKGGAYG
jgi:hypothetical protein